MVAKSLEEAVREQSVSSDTELETTTVKLPADVLLYLRTSAKKLGVSTGDMVRIALGTQKFLAEEVGRGATVQLKKANQTFDVTI